MKKEVTKTKKAKKKFSKQDWSLIATFIFLVVLVIILVIVALNMKNITENKKTNITIPVLEENSHNEISVDISEMKEGEIKEYIFAITNYKGYDINEAEIDYTININSTETTEIKLYKNDNNTNILKNNDLSIEDNKLKGNTKIEDTYRLIIESIKPSSNDAKITIEINS